MDPRKNPKKPKILKKDLQVRTILSLRRIRRKKALAVVRRKTKILLMVMQRVVSGAESRKRLTKKAEEFRIIRLKALMLPKVARSLMIKTTNGKIMTAQLQILRGCLKRWQKKRLARTWKTRGFVS